MSAPPGHDTREDVIAAARALAALGYIHAFGHVSIRWGPHLLITPTRPPFTAQRPEDLLEVDYSGAVLTGDVRGRPLEVFLHIGIYQARSDVQAICRTHAPAASIWPEGGRTPAIAHGFGGFVEPLASYADCDLVHDPERGARAAAALGTAHGLLLRGNGALAVGSSLGQAAARMWSLEERCANALRQGGAGVTFSRTDYEARKRWYAVEEQRVWNWMKDIGKQH
jgi:HCOMODA/2-hydroxy-3-carboxy-muconic semialdehyde decarboxylase